MVEPFGIRLANDNPVELCRHGVVGPVGRSVIWFVQPGKHHGMAGTQSHTHLFTL
jgi:hypothetical protein